MKLPYLLFLLLAACHPQQPVECTKNAHQGLTFFNNAVNRIQPAIYWNYPDTVIGSYNPTSLRSLKKGDKFVRGAGPNYCWEATMQNLPHQKEWIYIFDQDSLEAIPWDTIRATNRGLLERRLIDLDYLKQHDFIISYP
jgi:hypothetical protein